MKNKLFIAFALTVANISFAYAADAVWPEKVYYRYKEVMGKNIFYRESGANNSQTIVLLHGYPSSSHTYRELIPLLSGRYHVIAPDHIGSGFSAKPDPKNFIYNFDVLAEYVAGLLTELKVNEYVLYMQDFGAPVGFRLMMKNPMHIQAVVAQNANAYMEGIPPTKQHFFKTAQTDKSEGNVAKLYAFTSPDAVKHKQYLRDVQDRPDLMSPDTWVHDGYFLSTELERHIQVKLFQDYKTNLDSYPAWQKFLRERQPPMLLVWGERDPVFTAKGARAYLTDLPNAELHLLDAGHFAAEEKAVDIAKRVTQFLGYGDMPGTIEKQLKANSQ